MNLCSSQNIQMEIRTVITVLVLLCCYVGQRTQPAVTEADCCFFHLCRFCGICSGQEIFLAPSLNAAWNLGFIFFFSPTPPRPFLVYIYFIFLFHSCDLRHYAFSISGCPIFMNATFHKRMVGISLYLPQMSPRTQG